MSHLDCLLDHAPVQPARQFRLHIERVSLAGWAMTPAQSRQFGVMLAQELTRLARTRGWPAGGSSALSGLVAPPVASAPGGTPAMLGRDVARSLFDVLRRSA
jgi:hypothetical protein